MPRHRLVLAALVLALLTSASLGQSGPPAPSFPRPVTLKVVDEKGQAVNGALVELWPDERAAGFVRGGSFLVDDAATQPAPPQLSLHTDASGTAAMHLSSASEVFAASAAGIGTSGLWYAQGLASDAPTLQLKPPRELAGKVILTDGSPAPNADVRFKFSLKTPIGDWTHRGYGEPRPPADLKADSLGRFHVTAEGGFTGRAYAVLGQARTEDVPVYGEAWGQDLELRFPGEFHVRGVCLGPDGSPLADQTVVALRRMTDKQSATTGADGRFDIALVHAGRYLLDLDLPPRTELALAETREADVSEAAPVAEARLQALAAATIRGSVRGAGKVEVDVSAQTASSVEDLMLRHSGYRAAILFDGDGAFEIRGLDPSRFYDVVAHFRRAVPGEADPRWVGLRVHGVPVGATDVSLVFVDAMLDGATANVRCVDALTGVPLAGAGVSEGFWEPDAETQTPRVLIGRRTTSFVTDAVGLARCTGLGFDRAHGLLVSAPGHESVALGPIEASIQPIELTARLRPLVPCTARVLDPAGLPVPEASVLVFQTDVSVATEGYAVKLLKCDASGSVSFDGVQGAPAWIQASAVTGTSALVRFIPGSEASPLMLPLLAAPPPPRGSLDLRVLDVEGHAIPGIEVSAAPFRAADSKVPTAWLTVTTDADGVARFPELTPGIWSFKAFDLDRGVGFGSTIVPDGAASCVLRTQ